MSMAKHCVALTQKEEKEIADFVLFVGQNKELSLFSDVLLTERWISNRTSNVAPFTVVNMKLFCNRDFHMGDKWREKSAWTVFGRCFLNSCSAAGHRFSKSLVLCWSLNIPAKTYVFPHLVLWWWWLRASSNVVVQKGRSVVLRSGDCEDHSFFPQAVRLLNSSSALRH